MVQLFDVVAELAQFYQSSIGAVGKSAFCTFDAASAEPVNWWRAQLL